MSGTNKAPENSKATQKYRDKILEVFKQTGEINWDTLGISQYMRHYHSLNKWAQELVSASSEIIAEMEDICCDESCHVCEDISEEAPMELNGTRFVITTVDVGADLNNDVIQALKSYANTNGAYLIAIPQGVRKKDVSEAISQYENYFPSFDVLAAEPPLLIQLEEQGFIVATKEITLHPLLTVKPIFINPKVANPVLGLGPLANKYKSMIIPSTKQVLETRPSAKHELPYILASTGTISDSVYCEDYLETKQEAIADADHAYGAVVVEDDEDGMFHIRHLTCKDKKSFVDKGVRYPQHSPVKVKAIIPGDWHSGYTDIVAASVLFDVAEETKAEAVVLHDMGDGHSTNPHQKHQNITLGHLARLGKLDVAMEIAGITHDLHEWEKRVEQVYVVRSNHDEFIDRELENGKYASHPLSSQDLSVVAGAVIKASWPNGEIPYALPIAIEQLAYEKLKMPRLQKTTFLERDIPFSIANVDVSHHGDKLINGRPTSIQNVSISIPVSIVGHTHAPAMFRNTYRVGTSSLLDLSYNKGLCSWLHTFALLYEDGSVQLINIIKGKPWADYKSSGKIAQIATNCAHHRNLL
jgi:hypothetical protein